MPIRKDGNGVVQYTAPKLERQFNETGCIVDSDFAVIDQTNFLKQVQFNIVPTTTGPGVLTLECDIAGDSTLTLTGLVGSSSFTIIQPDSGTSPTATSPTDTLTLTSSNAALAITGSSSTNTITFSFPSQTANKIFASPNGSSGTPSFRSIVSADLPSSTKRVQALSVNTLPDTSGNVYFEPYPIKATNDFWKHGHFIFTDTATKDSLYSMFHVPMDYNSAGTTKIYAVWTSTATTGSVVWEIAYRSIGGNDTTSLDQTTAAETLSVTASAPSATDRRMIPSVTATAANFAAGDTVELKISRNGTSGSDTMAASAQLLQVLFEYTT